MRWFLNLFRQKKTLEQLKAWLAEDQQKQQNEQQQAIEQAQQAFPELLRNAKEAISALEQAELRNPNIPERAKHYMRGNREQFLRLTSRFVENLFVPKEGPDFSQLELLFHQYAQNTARPAAILSEFFGQEVNEVRKCLAEIEKNIGDIKAFQLKKERLQIIEALLKKLDDVKAEQERIAAEREALSAQLQQMNNKRDTLKKEKEQFTTRPEYLKVKEDLLTTTKERQDAEQAITGLFLPLSDAIKKYAHKMKNDKLAHYADNPVDALIHDYSLSILKHLPGISESLTQGELELKPEKSHKALQALKQLTKDNLSAMIHRYAKAKKREADMQSDVAQRPIMKEYEQYAIDLKTVTMEIEQLEKTISKLNAPTDEHVKAELARELEKHNIALI